MKVLENLKREMMMSSIIYMIIGLVMAIKPEIVSGSFSIIVGMFCLLIGVVRLTAYSGKKSSEFGAKINLIFGTILCLAGLFFVMNTSFITNMIPTVAGFILVVDGINKIKQAGELKNSNYDKWYVSLISACIMMTAGGLLIAYASESINLAIRILGIILIVDGLYDLIVVSKYSRQANQIIKTIELKDED